MPFKSEKQRRYLWANEPEIARDWTDTYGSRIQKNSGGITRIPFQGGGMDAADWDEGGDTPMPGGGQGSGHEAAVAAMGGHDWSNDMGTVGIEGPDKFIPPTTDQKDDVAKIIAKESKKKTKKVWDTVKKRFVHPTRKALYSVFPNNPKNEFRYIQHLKSNNRAAYDQLPQELIDLFEATEDQEHDFNFTGYKDFDKFSFDDFEALRTFDPGEGVINFADHAAKYGGAPALKYAGNVGNLETIKNADGTYSYRERTGDGGDGQDQPLWMRLGYRSESEWRNDRGGATGTTADTTTPSEFQQSLTADATGAGLPFDYWVGGGATQDQIDHMNQYGQYAGGTYAAEGGRVPAAFGGIMDSSTGRRAYGLGSIFSKIGRAAKKIIKSPIGKAALIAGGFGLAGYGPFKALNTAFPTVGGWLGKKGAIGKMFTNTAGGWSPWKLGIGALTAAPFFMGQDDDDDGFDYEGAKNKYMNELMRIKAGAMAGSLDPNKFNYLGVKDGGRIGLEGGGDPMLVEEYEKYVFELKEIKPWAIPMTFEQFKEQVRAGQAEGGRTGHYKGGQSIPSDFTLEDATISTTQDKLGGITDVMKQADLFRSGDVGQFYAAQGGRSGYGAGGKAGRPPINLIKGNDQPAAQAPAPMSPNQNKPMNQPMNPMMARGNPMMNSPMMNRPMMNPMMARGNPMGGRRMAEEGGLMDLGGRRGYAEGKEVLPLIDMGGKEKDYRNDGGFVPLGREERADDVPARLSKNEFVFTADAVRGAGGGDIDKGAEIMENVMENLENGGNISEESQGLEGARDMFATSQRLEGVI